MRTASRKNTAFIDYTHFSSPDCPTTFSFPDICDISPDAFRHHYVMRCVLTTSSRRT
ncbi:hypothetical protein WOLCODRAFT_28525, partial [Wolfiporia cocos MD-104 SS10]